MVRRLTDPAIMKFLFTALILIADQPVKCQEKIWNYFYRIHFTDKGENEISGFAPEDLLSGKAIERRNKAGIEVPDFRDIPVWKGYIDRIRSMGLSFHCTSKWMNTALFKSPDPFETGELIQLPFVKKVEIVKRPEAKGETRKNEIVFNLSDQPPYNNPLSMINGISVHNSNFSGKGILIAVIDGGFSNAGIIPALDHLRDRKGIKGTYDFVNNNEYVYDFHNHGTAVLSVLAGMIEGMLEGSAPGADYLLLRSEDTDSEYPVEEDLWTAAAEFADSSGADIITSSLGYYIFDDPSMDYQFEDMDGDRAFVTRAADIAASKGILVVNSAGNERNMAWKKIIAPSDGDSVLAVGAVRSDRTISSFSSAGPSADRQVKPDIVAQGVGIKVQISPNLLHMADGTSFSCPVISGICACIMQAVPQASNMDIISALHSSSDRYFTPDSLYGYGIPDIKKAIAILQDKYLPKPAGEIVVFPNPFRNEIRINLSEVPEWLSVEIYDQTGKQVMKKMYRNFVSRSLTLDNLTFRGKGLYFVRVITPDTALTHRIIKIVGP
ncbi:MAG TPA: S8 family serine peptidase [Bacteroidales bacterium]|nr:S8 family serine peptidase [Bacteroidales bacterium]